MLNACLIAVFVGGATILGGVIGYFVKYNNEKIDGAVFAFAAGVMLAATFAELILPETDAADAAGFFICLFCIVLGGALIHMLQKLLLLMQKKNPGWRLASAASRPELKGALLFIAALAIHNLPEGIAAGVGLGTGDLSKALTVAAGIALQNVPEGMIVLPPLIHAGVSRRKALLVSVFTGLIEIVGTFLAYFASTLSKTILPFVLCFAGGTMLYIICTDVIDDAEQMAGKELTGYAVLAGCCVMLIMGRYI